MTTNYTTLIQKYRAQRNPPRGSTSQVPMPTGATTGANFPQSQPQPAAPVVQTAQRYTPPVVGHLALPWRTMFFFVAFLSGAALLLIAILDGDVRLFQSQVPTTAPPVVYVERVVTATAMPTEQPASQVVIVTVPPPVYAQPARPAQPSSSASQRQPVRSLPAPTQVPAAWPAPQQQVTIVDPARPASQGSPSGAYSCTGFGPCPPPKREPQPTPKPHYIDRDPDDFDRFLDWMFNTQSVKKGR